MEICLQPPKKLAVLFHVLVGHGILGFEKDFPTHGSALPLLRYLQPPERDPLQVR